MTDSRISRFVSDGFEKAKGGDALAIYAAVTNYHDSGILPEKSHYAFGWIIYYALHQSIEKDIGARKEMLARYFRLKLTVPHKLHSMILTEAIRLYKDVKNVSYGRNQKELTTFSIVRFLELWNTENLRSGDWNRKQLEGKPLSSTVEKLITSYVDEIESSRSTPSSKFLEVIDKAVSYYPDSFNILSQRAAIHIINHDNEKGAELLRKALLVAPGKFFLWQRLAMTVSPLEKPHLHVALLYKALISPGQEQFKGRIRLSLAEVLISRGAFPQALWELQKIRAIYDSNGWHIPVKVNDFLNKIPNGTIPDNPERLYKKVEHLAEEEIYDSLPWLHVVKTYHKHPVSETASPFKTKPSAAWRVTDNDGNNFWLQPHRFKIDPSLPLGTPLFIRIYNGKAVKAKLT